MTPVTRSAVPGDVPAIARIYGHAVRESVATFDLVDPPSSTWHGKLASTDVGDHAVVVEVDGAVAGFAYSGAFRPREAYASTRETTVYVDPAAVGGGLGRLLYADLLGRLRADGVHTAIAVVAQPNPASVALHEAFGFRLVGTLQEVGRKFDRWVDTRWYQLRL